MSEEEKKGQEVEQTPIAPEEPTAVEEAPADEVVNNVELTADCYSPEKKEVTDSERISLLNVTMAELDEQLKRYPSTDFGRGEEGRRWATFITEAAPHLMSGSSYDKSVTREDSLWKQGAEYEGVDLVAKRPRLGGGDGSGKLSGERALLRVTSATGLGAVVQIPLWYTGIWVTIKAPGDDELLELNRRIAQEKIRLGRDTSGMVFSNESVYITAMVVNFALRRVYDASVKDITLSNLKNIIKVNDIPSLVWGLLCTIYPGGYPLARPCTADPTRCQHVVKETLNITKLLWVDNRALNEKQRKHMARRVNSFSLDEIEAYQEEHIRGVERTHRINDEVKLLLKVPTITEYEEAGYSWVDGIVEMVDGAFDVPLRGQERESYITEQARVSVMRQYAHWVDKIIVGDDVIDDLETLEDIMNRWSSDEDITTGFITRVGEMIDDSVVSLIAVPRYNCPKCNHPSGVDHKHPHLIPLEMVRVFFTLLHQRLETKLRPVKL